MVSIKRLTIESTDLFMVRRFFLCSVFCLYLIANGFSQASYVRPNASAYNPNNDHYYITNYLGKSVVKTDRSGNKSYFIQNLDAPNNILYGVFPFGEAFVVLDSNKGKVFDTSGNLLASVSISNAKKLIDLVYDDSLKAIFSTDVERGVIYKTTFGAAPNFTPSTSVWVSGISRPSNLILQKKKNRILLVQDTAFSDLLAIDLTSAAVSVLRSTGLSNLSGLAEDAEGNIYISSQYEKNIYQWNKYLTGSPKRVVAEPKPGDIFVNAAKDEWVYCCIICGNVYIAKLHTFGPAIEMYACAGDSVDVYKNTLIKCLGTFNSNNQFVLELSSPSGNFDTTTVLSVTNDTLQPFYLRVKIPTKTPGGNKYKFRFRTTNPAINGFAEVAKIGAPNDQQFDFDSMPFCGHGEEYLVPKDTMNVSLYWNPLTKLDSTIRRFEVSKKGEWVVLNTKNVGGCMSTDSVYTYPLFDGRPHLQLKSDSILYCSNLPKNARYFLWLKNGVYLKDTSHELIIRDSGYYQLIFVAKGQTDCDYVSDSLYTKYVPKANSCIWNFNQPKLQVFPNPVNDNLNICSSKRLISVNVFNPIGGLVKKVICNDIQFQLNVKDLPVGMYVIEGLDESGKLSRVQFQKVD